MTLESLAQDELDKVFHLKYETSGPIGSTPSLYRKFGYHNPDDYYEALVNRLVGSETEWLDVGCGRALFPSNLPLAKVLSERCKMLVGVDPDPTIMENPVVHEPVQESVYEYRTDKRFDLVTLRMVAEHIDDPKALLLTLSECTKDGSIVVIYTVNAWSPIPILTRVTPLAVRHPLKKLLWQTDEKDTFPTAYLMNTRKQLRTMFAGSDFSEVFFSYLDDCRTLARSQTLLSAELAVWYALNKISVRYPETCILAAYQRN